MRRFFTHPHTRPRLRVVPPPFATPPLYRGMFAVDIVGFGGRDAATHLHLRSGLYRIVTEACARAGLVWQDCHHEDRGDGILVIAPPNVSAQLLLDEVAAHIRAAARRHNRSANRRGRIRLRMAVTAGFVQHDPHGVSGGGIIHLYRMIDAASFKAVVAIARTDFALVVCDHLYQQIIRPGLGLLDPHAVRPLTIDNKETHAPAWVYLPPATAPAVPKTATRRPRHGTATVLPFPPGASRSRPGRSAR